MGISLLETCLKKFVNSHQVNLYLVGLGHLEPLCVASHIAAARWWLGGRRQVDIFFFFNNELTVLSG